MKPAYDVSALREALEEAGLPPDTPVEADCPILWSGWECDSHACLVRTPDGAPRILVLSATGGGDPTTTLEERLQAYDAATLQTRQLLAKAEAGRT